MTGMIFDIQHFCVDDGPGIRTTVFLKGCPLRCAWCHNPEGLSRKIQVAFQADQCVYCGRCVPACSKSCHKVSAGIHDLNRTECVLCTKCTEVCPMNALRVMGREASVEEVLSEVLKDQLFYAQSGGGMTLSGGEPFEQSEFAVALLKAGKLAGLHTCVETSGFCPQQVIEAAAKWTDLFLFDVKETDPIRHKQFTGVDNTLIISNLRRLNELGIPVVLRCPIIPEYNACQEHLKGIAELANSLNNVQEIHLEPYHPFGVDKYSTLGLEAQCSSRDFMPGEDSQHWMNMLQPLVNVNVRIS